MFEEYKVKTCIETNPVFWHSFLLWYVKWNDKKTNPADWTEGMCHEFLMEWYHTVSDRLGIEYEEIK
jgi:hypothetical protein